MKKDKSIKKVKTKKKVKVKKSERLAVHFLVTCNEAEQKKLGKIIDKSGLTRIQFFRKWIQEL